jgi:hemolysin activation/secretion protein
MILGAEFSGGWRERRPFQLSLGDRQGGVRGYDDTRAVGARRLVLRAERRLVVGGVSDWLALGVAGFADAGKVWAGRVPYGQTTPLRTSLGVGLLAAAPRQSRRLLRLDIAVPVARDPHAAKYELRFTTSKPLATFWREPGDIVRARAVVSPAGMVAWP